MKNLSKKKDTLNLGLRQILSTEFPKKCSGCQTIYMSAQDYIALTTPDVSNDSGPDYYLGANRICSCGSPLSAFSCRRDNSPAGKRRRAIFGRLIVELTQLGLDLKIARAELLKVLNKESSPILEGLGFKPHLLFPPGDASQNLAEGFGAADREDGEGGRNREAFGVL